MLHSERQHTKQAHDSNGDHIASRTQRFSAIINEELQAGHIRPSSSHAWAGCNLKLRGANICQLAQSLLPQLAPAHKQPKHFDLPALCSKGCTCLGHHPEKRLLLLRCKIHTYSQLASPSRCQKLQLTLCASVAGMLLLAEKPFILTSNSPDLTQACWHRFTPDAEAVAVSPLLRSGGAASPSPHSLLHTCTESTKPSLHHAVTCQGLQIGTI